MPDQFVIGMKFFAQLHNAAGSSANGYDNICTHVPSLYDWQCPNTIPNVVPARVIKSFKRPSLFAFPHIIEKSNKTTPFCAKLYPSTSIFWMSMIQWILAPLNKSSPDRINSACSRFSIQITPSMSMFELCILAFINRYFDRHNDSFSLCSVASVRRDESDVRCDFTKVCGSVKLIG